MDEPQFMLAWLAFLLALGLGMFSMVEASSFSLSSFRRGFVVFRSTQEIPATPRASLINREVRVDHGGFKLMDEHCCLFQPYLLSRGLLWLPAGVRGEIQIRPDGFAITGRIPYSSFLALCLIVAAFVALSLGGAMVLPPLPPTGDEYLIPWPFAAVPVATVFALCILTERHRAKTFAGKVLRVLSSEGEVASQTAAPAAGV